MNGKPEPAAFAEFLGEFLRMVGEVSAMQLRALSVPQGFLPFDRPIWQSKAA
jgi:hypothetical protein